MTDGERMVFAAAFGAVMATCGDPDEYGRFAARATERGYLAVMGLRLAQHPGTGNSDPVVMAREFSEILVAKGDPS